MNVEGPTEIDRGYFEVRINWTAKDLMVMDGKDLDHLKALVEDLKQFEVHVDALHREAVPS